MNIKIANNQLRSLKLGMSALALALMTLTAQAQQQEHSNPNVRLGQKALLEGDFKSAVTHLEKAMPTESKDPDVLYLLGYSQFQSGDFQKAATSFGKVVALDAKNANAYYYKAKANNALAENSKLSNAQREQLLQSAIGDYTKAIAVNANDAKLYQNRAVTYRDLGILKGTAGTDNYNKVAATEAYNKAVTDYEKVLSYDAARKDIQTELKKAKIYRDNLK
ncbi:tetratricopeptide repeat protein [Sphingobacterium yanglingense]|uniref:Tetratricopeptide repeat protein n=1 Tax=Sphingobacterium yanglingense TaxID=1437280 RepID=A0A4R6WGX5_9SPHI|nr:tetratricopeptide repeat protein [Sphingobacterium yanglingense]TDQ77020.1 tetratricopeptide repeat protein [Sphingobacterium yanglingense]